MYSLNHELKEKLENINNAIQKKYGMVLEGDKNKLREFLGTRIGDMHKIDFLSPKELEDIEKSGGICGVDGSSNRAGGNYPHYIEVYQALAKTTVKREEPLYLSEIYTPVIINEDEDELSDGGDKREEQKNRKLALLEVEAAIKAIKVHKPYAILMDGGLIRYNIYAGEKWEELVEMCEDTGTILIGVIKDIKTRVIGEQLKKEYPELKGNLYDRELLFGLLEYRELLSINESVSKKEPMGYSSAFLRSSLSPMAIGLDIIESQREHLIEMARLVLSLTPQNSRGVPLWIDIVDKEVKISDQMMTALLERYLDRGVYERFFVSERDKRS
ncbi:DNA double-strand break repair nuclease NurA [Gudongella sp. DL1XJH-153]|uniref:DNA double-strand break repair nuclease NurA n=1 Tax=Gudongella sp. DL1XJH-153 TaxID=3409804 RepID=UPI003BB6C0C3